jgi:hypothetical protein
MIMSYHDDAMTGIARASAFVLLALAGCIPIDAFECRDDNGCEEPPDTSEGCSDVLIAARGFELCEDELTWAQARDACALRSMTLASIHVEMESEGLGALVPSPRVVWIGLSDRDVEGDYAWVDLSPTDFTAWGPNEPEDADGEEDCVALDHEGAWSAWRCETPQPYVCADPP